jgi:hypothetical protein
MNDFGWWDMFTNYGAVEFYLMYTMAQRTKEAAETSNILNTK